MDLAHFANLDARRAGTPPTPLAPLVLCAAGLAVVLGLEALGGLGGDSLVVAPVSLALLGLVQTVRRWDARRRLRAEAEPRSLSAVPLNRIGLRPCRAELVALGDRLEAFERPVSPSGVLAVQRLLTEPGSVLYAPSSFEKRPLDTTSAVLGAILHHLEVRS
jgi:hypothetical protein